MKNLSKVIKTIKMLTINLLICSLMQNPLITNSLAAESNAAGFGAKDIYGFTGLALNTYGQYLGQKQQIIQQQIASTINQKLMSQMSPACLKPDGSACFSGSAKLFPECTLPASMSNMPANICTNATPEPVQISTMITYESIAQGWMNYYDQMSNEASNAAAPTGLRCLQDKEKAVDSQITEMMNSLQRLQDRLNQDKQIFRDNNKKLLEEMNTANDELFGGAKNNLKIKTADFAKYFSQSCQSVIGKESLNAGKSNGLNGILQGLSSNNKAAADFSLNKPAIEDDVRREADKITQALSQSGNIDDFIRNPAILNEINARSPVIAAAAGKQLAEFNTARERIAKELKAVNYDIPAMDKNFSVDMEDFMSGANDFFKKKYVNDCVTGNSSGVAIPIEDVLKNIEQRSTNSEGTARNDYRIALKNILSSDAMISDKMEQIKALDENYPGMSITYKDFAQNRVTDSPYNLFMKTIERCEERFAQDDQFSSKGSAGVSYQKKVERAKASLLELKNIHDGLASKINGAIIEKVLNCEGEAYKSGSSCSEDALKPSSANFCMAHANQCANDIQSCYSEANNQVQLRKNKMENLAKTYNTNVAAMIARSNALYEQQKAAVTSMTKLIQTKFPGSNFEIPKDMFISMPEMKKDTFGVEMAGDGDMKTFLEGENSMPAKLDKLKQMFKMQKEAVKKATDEYIALQKSAMERERGRWAEINTKCKGMIDSSSRELAKMNNENQKRQGEEDARVAKFCKKYYSINQNPVGACGKAKDLSDTADQIASRLSGKAQSVTEQYTSACDGFMNESNGFKKMCKTTIGGVTTESPCPSDSSVTSGANANLIISPKEFCGNSNTSDKVFITKLARRLPSKEDQEKIKDVDTFKDLLAKNENDNLNDGNFISNIDSLVGGMEGTICAKILDIMSPKEIKIANEELKKAKTDLSEENDDSKKKALSDKIKVLNENLSKLKEENKTVKDSLNEAFSGLANISKKDNQSNRDYQAAEIQKIGMQAEGPCDMQNNTSLAKAMGGMFDLPRGFDEQRLGVSK